MRNKIDDGTLSYKIYKNLNLKLIICNSKAVRNRVIEKELLLKNPEAMRSIRQKF